MTKILTSLLLLILITSVSGNIQAQTNTYRINVGDFTSLKVYDNATVIYKSNPDSVGYAVYEAEHKFANAFIFSNNGKGTLKVQVVTEDVNLDNLPVVYVYSTYLNEVESSSAAATFIDSPAPCPLVKARLIGNGKLIINNINATTTELHLATGNGTIVANGNCKKTKIKTVGTGVIQADELESKEVHCSILGTGTIGCNPTELLKVKGIGSTKIYYKGSPEIKKNGGGKLIPIDSDEITE